LNLLKSVTSKTEIGIKLKNFHKKEEMKIAKYPVLFLIGIMNALFVTAENATKNSTESDTWALLGRETRKLWSDCKKVVSFCVVFLFIFCTI
jgi:hypothetical protein